MRSNIGIIVFIAVSAMSSAALYAQPMMPTPNPPRIEKTQDEFESDRTEVGGNTFTSPIPDNFSSYSSVGTLLEPCEDLSGVTTDPSTPSYSMLQSEIIAEGTNAFHLANPNFEDHSISIDQAILPESNTTLFLQSRLGYATAGQTAKLQVSNDSGASWTTLWSRIGSGDAGQSAFELVTVALGDYAGSEILLRFLFDHTGGSAYTGTTSSVGWIIDDIQVGTDLQTHLYDGFGEPTPAEIISVEFINRARADAAAEAQRLKNTTDSDVLNAINYFNVDLDEMVKQFATLDQSLPPLAINGKLTAAARLHSQDMYDNLFQGHVSSSNPPYPNQPGDTLGDRVGRQNYGYGYLGENVFAYAKSVWHAHAGFNIDWGNDAYGMQVPPGHREAIHSPNYREIGVGILEGTNSDGSSSVGPMLVTQDFGTQANADQPFLVGVSYVDENGDGLYSDGEGLGGVNVSVEGARYYTVSSTYGSYAVPLPSDGTYEVTFTASGYENETHQISVTDSANVKLDYSAQFSPPTFAANFRIDEEISSGDLAVAAQIEYSGPSSDLGVAYSSDLSTWTTIDSTVTPLGGNAYHIECTPPDLPIVVLRLLNNL